MKKNSWMTWFIVLAFLMPMGIIIIINIVSPTTFMIQKAVDDMVVSSFDYEKAFSIYVEWFAAFCTILLGIVAATQNNRLQALEEKSVARNDSCNIYIENGISEKNLILAHTGKNEYKKSWDQIKISFENFSDAFLKSIKVYWGNTYFYSDITIAKGKKETFSIHIPKQLENVGEVLCKIEFTSCYNVKTYGDFVLLPKLNGENEKYEVRYISDYHFYGTEQPK